MSEAPILDLSVLPGFVAIILVFLAPPGPDMTYILTVGLQGGRSAAVRAILGIGTGMGIYALAVALGLGTILSAHPTMLLLVQLLGCAYLLWLAATTLRHVHDATATAEGGDSRRWYVRGLTVSLTNPKLILFFLAVLPRFVGRARNTVAQMLLLGVVNVIIEVLLYGAIGVFASVVSGRFIKHRRAQTWLNYLAGSVYLLLALAIGIEAIGPLLGA